ncbi:radical SAM protein [Clostridium sp. WLY-B-L2]|uniref:Radical SAM protein n=1 Tax=Clostridium aromativorans TaxID=2836848 RepID=A0ABS8N8N5_9CLOT|nr:radical SAM protein [Clostridium aromativorans]MCC9296158.1 radical SAM protein [Clostridium aromativorans]
MKKTFNLSEYMSRGIEIIVKNVLKSSIKNPKETQFLIKYMLSVSAANNRRNILESKGEHIPPFLMASISSSCNLYCKGCYARASSSCGDNLKDTEISEERWEQLFNEARELGISFILLLGGEPLMRRGIIEKASSVKEIVFPIFTNGILLDEDYINLIDKNRNLVPIISIEGNEYQTDSRRGKNTYNSIMTAVDNLNKRKILFGCSITVTTENIKTVTNEGFVQDLYNKGTRVLVFVEYTAVVKSTEKLAPTKRERLLLEKKLEELRQAFESMVFLSFPGDEKYMGGCLAAGRGFFHINANGSAEPCPLSPYSDVNLKDSSLREALKSPLFKKLKDNEMLVGEHKGGCTLFKKEDDVKKFLST